VLSSLKSIPSAENIEKSGRILSAYYGGALQKYASPLHIYVG
jgi:hypothetical protein